MKKLILGMAGCLWVIVVGPALSQDNNGLSGTPPIYHQNTRQQPSHLHKYVHQPFPLKDGKKKGMIRPQGHFYSLAPKKTNPLATPPPAKINLTDKNGHPVTLWQAVHKKNYPTLYQDH